MGRTKPSPFSTFRLYSLDIVKICGKSIELVWKVPSKNYVVSLQRRNHSSKSMHQN